MSLFSQEWRNRPQKGTSVWSPVRTNVPVYGRHRRKTSLVNLSQLQINGIHGVSSIRTVFVGDKSFQWHIFHASFYLVFEINPTMPFPHLSDEFHLSVARACRYCTSCCCGVPSSFAHTDYSLTVSNNGTPRGYPSEVNVTWRLIQDDQRKY